MLVEPEPVAPSRGSSDEACDVSDKARKKRLDEKIKRQRSFEDFADAVLALNGAWPLDAYGLHVADRELRDTSYRWIRRGLVRCCPEELRVTYGYRSPYNDPLYLLARRPEELGVPYSYRSHHMEPLFSVDFISGGAGALPLTSRLMRLHLSGLTLSKKFADGLKSECPVLEELKLVKCDYDYKFSSLIASRSLKRLHVEGSNDSFSTLDPLAVPALVSLNLDKVSLPDSEVELQSLAVASIKDPEMYDGGYRFLKFLRDARVLELRRFTTTGLLEDEPLEFCEFHNLRTLILIECDIGDGCQVLRYVLENVPNLETLVLQYCKVWGCYMGESASSCNSTAIHGYKNLKSIQVKYKDYDVPRVLVVLTQIAKNVVRRSKRNSVGWLDWMRRVVSCSQIIFLSQQYAVDSVVAEYNSQSDDDEHESRVWKHRGRKKHDRDGAVKARRRAVHPV